MGYRLLGIRIGWGVGALEGLFITRNRWNVILFFSMLIFFIPKGHEPVHARYHRGSTLCLKRFLNGVGGSSTSLQLETRSWGQITWI